MPRRYSVLLAIVAAALSGYTYWRLSEPEDRRPGRRLTAIAISPSGQWIAAGSAAGWVSVWEIANPDTTQQQFSLSGAVPRALAFSADEASVGIAHSGGFSRHSVRALEPLHNIPGKGLRWVGFDPFRDGWYMVSDSGYATDSPGPGGWGDYFPPVERPGPVRAFAWSEPRSLWAVSGVRPALGEAHSGKLLANLTQERGATEFDPVAFDEARGWVLMGSTDGRVYAWDLATYQLRATSPDPAGAVDSLAVLAGTPWIAYARAASPVRIWNPETGQQKALTAIPSSNIVPGPDAGTILLGNTAGSVQSWDVSKNKMLWQHTLR